VYESAHEEGTEISYFAHHNRNQTEKRKMREEEHTSMISSKVYAVASTTRSCYTNSGGEKGGADAVVAVGWGDLDGGGRVLALLNVLHV